MLVRFSNANGCPTCTQTVDFNKLRAIGMFQASDSTYFVRLSFDGGDTYMAKQGMSLADAVAYRNMLEGYWLSSTSTHSVHTGIDAIAVTEC